ncbi:MAG: RnfABCDGE type electron transport complex subunit D, partial [Oscillospiraceae bacterium]|nr:RnfABCDGE type electron transport complex subunit D [Oscillospiraceae bacterium]
MKKQRDRIWCAVGSPATWTTDYLIALLGVYFWAIYVFGVYDINRVLAGCFSVAIVFSLCMQLALQRTINIRKLLSAAVNGFLVGFLMPAGTPLWVIVTVMAIAILPFELPYLGQYLRRYVHPIALAAVFMIFVFPQFKAANADCLIGVAGPIP